MSQQCELVAKKGGSTSGCQQARGDDVSLLLSTATTHLESWVQFWAHWYKKCGPMQKAVHGWKHLTCKGKLREQEIPCKHKELEKKKT